jgi:hypothetical protein
MQRINGKKKYFDLPKENRKSEFKKGGDLNAEKRWNRPPGPGSENGTRPGKMQS